MECFGEEGQVRAAVLDRRSACIQATRGATYGWRRAQLQECVKRRALTAHPRRKRTVVDNLREADVVRYLSCIEQLAAIYE